MKKRKVLKIVDKFGWAFYFTTIEQMRYTKHDITYLDWYGFIKNFNSLDYDVIYFPSPLMCQDKVNQYIKKMKSLPNFKNTKIIGAYSGFINRVYAYADLVLPISISDYPKLRNESIYPVAFLPESIDTKMFTNHNVPVSISQSEVVDLKVGWAGKNQKYKRPHLLDDLLIDVQKQCSHSKEDFYDGKGQGDMVNFYHNLDVLILPSIHECMPRCVLEAMSCGLPVIGTNVGSIPWMLQKEMVVDAEPEEECIKQINKKLKMFYDNPELKEEIGQRNRLWAERYFSWEKNQPLWDEAIDALCENDFEKIDKITNNYLNTINRVKDNPRNPITKKPKTKINILKVIDVFGWAYDFIYKEQSCYATKHRLSRDTLPEVHRRPHAKGYDIVYFSGANLGETNTLTRKFRLQNAKIIGAYAGENYNKYQENDLDLVVSISYPFTEKLKEMYTETPVIFMPEGIDAYFFKYQKRKSKRFNVGWAGRLAPVKRSHLLDKFKYPVKIQCNHSEKDLSKEQTREPMRQFYNEIDVLILPSKSECMPRVVLEAMATGMPVVATDVGSINLLLDKEWIVPNTTDKEIIENINKKLDLLKNNSKLREKVGKRNRKHIDKYFSWYVVMPLWEKLYEYLYQNNFDSINTLTNNWLNSLLGKKRIKTSIQTKSKPPLKQIAKLKETLAPTIPNLKNVLPLVSESKQPIEREIIIKVQGKPDLEQTLLELLDSSYKFWLLGHSCKEAIKSCELFTSPIEIAVESNSIKEEIEKMNLLNLKISVNKPRRLKQHHAFGREVSVPLPVVKYLKDFYGKSFEEIINE